MSYLCFHSRAGEARLSGREVASISLQAERCLARELTLPAYRRLRAELELPAPGTTFYMSQVSWLASDGEAHRVQGQDVYLFDLAFNLWYQQQPAAGILCWLYDQALGHGWIAATDQRAFAAEIQAALDAGIARPAMGWDGICSLLDSGAGDVVTSLPGMGGEFPDRQLALEAGTWSPRLRSQDDPDELDGRWDQVGQAGQWDLCMPALHAQPARQWRPGRGYVFGDFTLTPETGLAGPGSRASALRPHEDMGVQRCKWVIRARTAVRCASTPVDVRCRSGSSRRFPGRGTASWCARPAGRPGTP